MDSENSKGKAAKAKDKKKAKKASSSGSSSEESGETSSGGESLCTEAKKGPFLSLHSFIETQAWLEELRKVMQTLNCISS